MRVRVCVCRLKVVSGILNTQCPRRLKYRRKSNCIRLGRTKAKKKSRIESERKERE